MKKSIVLLLVITISVLFVGCKVKKSDNSTYKIKEVQVEDVATTKSSEKETEIKSGSKKDIESNTAENKSESSEESTESWKETNYYDKEGNLRKTVKEGSTKTKKTDSKSDNHNNTQVSDSTYTDTNITEVVDSTSVSSFEQHKDVDIDMDQNTQSDSRLIQGVEWIYVIGTIVVIGCIIIFIVRKRKK